VLLDAKPRRCQLTKIIHASGEVKSAIALLALKMMVMFFARALVSSRFSRYFNGLNPTLSQQCANRAVDGRHTEALDFPRRCPQQLIDASYGITLFCLPGCLNHGALPSPLALLQLCFFASQQERLQAGGGPCLPRS
jgi:hypothetical protein